MATISRGPDTDPLTEGWGYEGVYIRLDGPGAILETDDHEVLGAAEALGLKVDRPEEKEAETTAPTEQTTTEDETTTETEAPIPVPLGGGKN